MYCTCMCSSSHWVSTVAVNQKFTSRTSSPSVVRPTQVRTIGVHSAYNYCVPYRFVRWLCVLLSVSTVCNRTFDKRQSCSSYKEWITVSGNWQHCQKTWLRPPLQNSGWIKALVEQKMREDNETVAVQLHVHAMLKEHEYNTSLHTILRCWKSLEWTFRGT